MSFEFKINRKNKTTGIVVDGKLIKVLSEKESIDFYDDLKQAANDNQYLFNIFWERMDIDDIENEICPIQEVKGIEFNLSWYYENTHFSKNCTLMVTTTGKREDSKSLEEVNIYDNFPKEKFLSGSFTNHELRNCLTEELSEQFKNNPNFKIYFNSEEIKPEHFFDEFNTYYYKTGNEYDVD